MLSKLPQARLTVLYLLTDCLRRRGACVKNLSHSASLQVRENNAPSNAETKQLGRYDRA